MALTDVQKEAVTQWVKEGAGLSEIQKRLASEFQCTMTFMDVRFLILDLGLEVKERSQRETPAKPIDAPVPADRSEDDDEAEEERTADLSGTSGGPSRVSVRMDRITKPGAVVSGTVVFSDGVSATWFLDQLGRLGIGASSPGYKPSESDVRAFQKELQSLLQKSGF